MIQSPFRYEANLTSADFEKLGRLSLRWSRTEHVIANCLKVTLRLTEEEGAVIVFPLVLEHRIQRIEALRKLKPLSAEADHAFTEYKWAVEMLKPIRNMVAHALLLNDGKDDQVFESRSKGTAYKKEQIFETEELTNYAAQAALVFRYALGEKDPQGAPDALPGRPALPGFLRKDNPTHK
jgi:hypothetical protein